MLNNIQNIQELSNYLNTLSYNDFKNIVDNYSNKYNVSFDKQMNTIVINNLESKLNELENDYGCTNINEKTAWLWRMKLIHSIANLPQPKLTGNI